MSIRFAGSRCVDERRRRRLAQGADTAPHSVVRPKPSRAHREEDGKLPRGSSPADSLISPRWWPHALVATLGLLAWASVLVVGDQADQARTGLEAIIGLAAGKLTKFFSTVMLLTAGQLAFISLWYRSRSRKDFSGSYKVWFWAAVGWLTLCAFRATGAHWNLADAALAGRPVALWNGQLVVWLIPTAILVVALYRLLLREMRDCSLSLWTLRLSGLAAMAAGLVLLGGQFVWTPRVELLASAGLGTLWHTLLALAMLLHARHVIHETNEPPQRTIVPWRAWFSLPRRGKTGVQTSASRATKAKAKPRRATTRKATAKKTATTRATSKPEPDEPHEQEAPEDVEPSAPVRGEPRPVPARAAAPAPVRRVDSPAPSGMAKPHFVVAADTRELEESDPSEWTDDESDDDGEQRPLSKKERRRQKKLARSR